MIKRRFYRFEHGDKDAASESSSSSDSEVEAEAEDDTEVEDDEEDVDEENIVSGVRDKGEASSSSGYESEDSSANEVNLDSSGLPTSDEDGAVQNGMPNVIGRSASKEANSLLTSAHHSPEKDAKTDVDMYDYVLKRKSVFKCRLCPRIVCLSEETLKAHLISKRHARSEKLLKEGRLKLMLNEKGKVEGEIPAEDHATTTTAPEQNSSEPNKKGKGKGRWKRRKRSRQIETKLGEDKPPRENREKRRKKQKETILTSKQNCSS